MKGLSPRSLAEMGQTLWGPRWAEPLAEALSVNEQDVVKWDANPATIPENLEDQILNIGEKRLQDIQMMLADINSGGLRRNQAS